MDGEEIICPFHGFAFDRSGSCVRTGYGYDPPASLTRYPVLEANYSIYVWRHADGLPPDWEIPDVFTMKRSAPSHRAYELAGNPQDLAESLFDFGHFFEVHRMTISDLEVGDLAADEKTCDVTFRLARRLPGGYTVAMRQTVKVIGLCTVLLESMIPNTDTTMRLILHATPTAPGRMCIRHGAAVDVRPTTGACLGLNWALSRLAGYLANQWTAYDIAGDLTIWNQRAYLDHPKIARGDGPVGRYRQWTKQFYPI